MFQRELDLHYRFLDYLLQNFFVLREDGWYQERAEKEKVKFAQIHQEAVERGKRSAEVRREKYGSAQPVPRKRFESLSKASGNASEPTTTTSTTTSITTSTSIPNKDKSQKNRSPSAPDDVCQQVWEDWKQIRKAKKSPVTDTAIKGIRAEAKKAGISFEDALRISCERGWAGFKAEWVSKQAVGGDKYAAQAERVIKLLDGEIFDAK
jgi:uncharacterized protein YdaU (DUF1376 family)